MEICDGLTDKHTVTDGQTEKQCLPRRGGGGGGTHKIGATFFCVLIEESQKYQNNVRMALNNTMLVGLVI